MPAKANLLVILNKLLWFLHGVITSGYDAFLWFLYIRPAGTKLNINKDKEKIIMYAGEFLPPRIARLAKWCKRFDGFTTVLLCHKHGYVQKFSNEEVDVTFLFRNKWHLKRLIRALPAPYIMHNFAPKSKYPFFALETVKELHPSVPVVTDYQDVLVLYYGLESKMGWLQKELPFEQRCFQSSDGIVAESLEPFEGMKIWGINNKKKRIYFPLYADNDSFCHTSKSFSTDDIHLVYAGGVTGSHRDKAHYGATQFQWLIEYLSKQKIHFHIYPSPSGLRADYLEYEDIASENSFFHFHKPVKQDKLAHELSKYHYGLMPFFSQNSGQSPLKFRYATTLKLFNYIEAGIPIFAGADVVYQSWIGKRYDLGIVVRTKEDFANIRNLIGIEPYDRQVERVISNREHLSLKKHIPRLLKYYGEL